MKKLLFLTAVGAILATPAVAVQKCVALDASMSCSASNWEEFENVADWELPCTTNGTSVILKGVFACSKIPGDMPGETRDFLPTTSYETIGQDVNCWCKMISPAMSSWIYVDTSVDSDSCNMFCASLCLQALPMLKSVLLGAIYN
ncbi:MAG: hypothetical protein IKB05_02235 [Alphaproteobacteria bacterium]|nr:hypothetical protein [Alphaproteobacteria bacterium]